MALSIVHRRGFVLHWIPVHCGIPGIEEADSLTELSRKEQVDNLATFSEMSNFIQNLHKITFHKDKY